MANLERNCKLAQQNNGELDASIDNPIQSFDPIDEAMSMDITCVKDVFPLHDIYELAYLRRQWTTMSVPANALKRCNFQGMTAQPIDSIRDYYGEQPAMYFAFLENYTNSLKFPAVLGLLTLVGVRHPDA